MSDCFVLYLLLTCMKKKTSGADKFTNNNKYIIKVKLIWDRIKIKVTYMMQTGCIPLKRIRKSNSSWKRKADMDEKPMKARRGKLTV